MLSCWGGVQSRDPKANYILVTCDWIIIMDEKYKNNNLNKFQKKYIIILLIIPIIFIHLYLAIYNIDHSPHYDEMFHILAADTYNINETYQILDGKYDRAKLYTRIVAESIKICENKLECARYISIISTIILLVIFTYIISFITTPVIGILTGLFIATNPIIINQSLYIRFYTLHSLFFTIGTMSILILLLRWKISSKLTKIHLILLSFLFLILAYHLQETTLIGSLGIFLGLLILLYIDNFNYIHKNKIRYLCFYIMIIIFIAVCYFVFFDYLYLKLSSSAPWALNNKKNFLYYHLVFENQYPAIWPIAPLLCTVGCFKWPKQNIFMIVIFITSFIVLSIAAQKSGRYILYALPFLFASLSAGLVTVVHIILKYISSSNNYNIKFKIKQTNISNIIWKTGIYLTIILFIITQPIFNGIVDIIIRNDKPQIIYNSHVDWEKASIKLKEMIHEPVVLITSSGVKAAYYFGDYSYELSYNLMHSNEARTEFSIYPVTGRKVISSVKSLKELVMTCGPVIVIVDESRLNNKYNVPEETKNYLKKHGKLIDIRIDNLYIWKFDKKSSSHKKIQQIDKNNVNNTCYKVIL